MKCVRCNEDQPDGDFCRKCGTNQKTGDIPAAVKEPCLHCNGYGTCTRTKITATKRCSCELCISTVEKKLEKKLEEVFPVVPCSVCDGKGFHIIEAAKPKQQPKQQSGNRNNRNQSGGAQQRGGRP
jgi:hypothetical protein